ncbi:hypothetical protein PRIPAC_75251 [Pristionchus pacificus]|uniref:Uncharacterized protein n=1 Tax=Pristionchus pacificus TaxID=54126 RepID=A0A2A6CSR6_PRIPA|nr:hypothetical protein PRIPAC_75251 [Pristionchus pacificus]|eukprot:PDM81126.1 hypothetical protein PRIPAC_36129 [Pristionchus pacificus]
MERNYIESTDESVVNTQDQGEISTERYKKRFSNSSRVKDVVLWIETLKPTFLSCNDPVIIYALRGGEMPERELKKLEDSQRLCDVAGKSTFLPIVVDRSNMLYTE